ncbi:hypothetical protein EYF80_001674 [Liparis tanakae]|uniref:Uncharacterized protein n=1 Tax=Liparis tanakae TaxID=230148 RepID=A0A4Z2JE98_9TELE|nr:hypothetical protein EYF80_001674 [Liparis tanakae]
MATILAPRLERRFLLPANEVESGPPPPGLFSALYMVPEMLEERTTLRAAALSPLRPLRPLIPPGLGTSTEPLSIMVSLDWRAGKMDGASMLHRYRKLKRAIKSEKTKKGKLKDRERDVGGEDASL